MEQGVRDGRGLEVTFRLGYKDLYWAYETSRVGLICTLVFAGLGLMFVASAIPGSGPADRPIAADVEVGILFLLLAPVFMPAVMIWATRGLDSSAKAGLGIRLRFTEEGIEGWTVPLYSRETIWSNLRHPRAESRVLVLPFSHPWASAWVIVPARAFTPQQFDRLMEMLRRQGFFEDGDHRSKIGRLLSRLFDSSGHLQPDGRLAVLLRLTNLGPKPSAEATAPRAVSVPSTRPSPNAPRIVIRRSRPWRNLGVAPLAIGDDWIKIPIYARHHWSEIARVDRDPGKRAILRLWTFAGGKAGGEVNEIPMRLGLKMWEKRPSEVERVILEEFERSRSEGQPSVTAQA